jgi:hypothetical protein
VQRDGDLPQAAVFFTCDEDDVVALTQWGTCKLKGNGATGQQPLCILAALVAIETDDDASL